MFWGYKLECVEYIVVRTKVIMASNRVSFIWVLLFVFVLGLLFARASTLKVADASGFHASK